MDKHRQGNPLSSHVESEQPNAHDTLARVGNRAHHRQASRRLDDPRHYCPNSNPVPPHVVAGNGVHVKRPIRLRRTRRHQLDAMVATRQQRTWRPGTTLPKDKNHTDQV
jgi:hypothetical protein